MRGLGFAFGAALFYFSVSAFGGFAKVLEYLKLLRWGYVVVVANAFVGVMLFTRAWYLYLGEHHHHLSYWRLLKVRMCGEAVNFMTPLGFAAGDPVRLMLLRKYLGVSSHLRSVVIDRVMHLLAAYLFCVVGAALILIEPVVFPRWLAIGLVAFYGSVFFIIGFLVLDLLRGKGLGFFDHLLKHLTFLKRFPKIEAFIAELREDLAYYADKPKGPFIESFITHFVGRSLGAIEIALILYFLSGQIALSFAFMLGSLTSFFGVAFGFIPGALGVLETVYAQFFLMNGFSPELGISIQVVRRLRVFFWIALGAFILDYQEILAHWRQKKVKT